VHRNRLIQFSGMARTRYKEHTNKKTEGRTETGDKLGIYTACPGLLSPLS